MKIHVLSDLHREFGFTDLRLEIADLLIIAGDLHVGTKGIQWLLANVTNIPVIYVLGNHEYYRGSYPKTLLQIKERAAGSNVHVLEDESITLNNITFHGSTLWTNFELFGDPRITGSICQEKMNDYKLIRRDPSYSKLRSIDTFKIHKASLKWLEKSLETSTTQKNIVVTHHAPSIRSIPAHYKDDELSAAYASDLESFILKHQPDYWIHGHIHDPMEYVLGKTNILCNPHGYINEKHKGFNPELILDI